MTTLEIVATSVASFLGGGGVIGAIVKARAQRTMATDAKLWERVDTLESRLDAKNAECDQKIAAVEAKVDAAEQRGEECERRSGIMERELLRLRDLLRKEDDTPRLGSKLR